MVDASDELSGVGRGADGALVDAVEDQLGAAEHLDCGVGAEIAPCEVDESVHWLALYGRADTA